MSPLLRLGAPLHTMEITTQISTPMATTTRGDDFVTFGWSDFPLLGTTATLEPTATAGPTASSSCFLEMEPSEESQELLLSDSSEDDQRSRCSQDDSVEAAGTHCRRRRRPDGRELKVSFASIDVREYNVILGDHDYPEDGLPLSLGWGYVAHASITVDDYEELRPGRSFPSKPQKLGYYERKNRLKRVSGYSESELRHLERERQETASCGAHHWCSPTDDDFAIRQSPSYSNLLDYRSTV